MLFDRLGLLGACNGGDVNGHSKHPQHLIQKRMFSPKRSAGMVPLVSGV